MMTCDWCEAQAKYEINESKACGNHVTAAIVYQTSIPPRECKVSKLEEEE